MPKSWDWPGSRWWRVDLHAHSPASHDFQGDRDNPDWNQWVNSLRTRNIDAVAVTDHNTADGIDPIQTAAQGSDLFVFPGVELTVGHVHLLLILDPSQSKDDVTDILTRAHVPVDKRGRSKARSPVSVEQLLADCGKSAIVIGAHINGPAGLLSELKGQKRLAVLGHPLLAAVEVDPNNDIDEDWINGTKPDLQRRLTPVWGSDAHGLDTLGQRYTWIKMTVPSSEGLRLALGDGSLVDSSRSVQRWTVPDPNTRFACDAVESITVADAKYIGRPTPMMFCFNPWLNAIIGGRGTGKSTLVDFFRQTLRREGDLPKSLRSSFDRRLRVPDSRGADGLLTSSTHITVIYRKDGERFQLSWRYGGNAHPVVRLAENGVSEEQQGDIALRFPVRLYSQKQLFELAQDPDALLALMDDSSSVQGHQLRRSMKESTDRYLALRSQARLARQQAAGLPDLLSCLSDVRRKLDVLQEGDHANILAQHRRSQQEQGAWDAVCNSVRDAIGTVRSSVDDLEVVDLGIGTSKTEDVSDTDINQMHKSLCDVVAYLRQQVYDSIECAQKEIDRIRKSPTAVHWRETVRSNRQGFKDALASLSDHGIGGFEAYQELLTKNTRLKQDIGRAVERAKHGKEFDEQAKEALNEYRMLRQELADSRQAYAADASSDVVKISVRAMHDSSLLQDELGKRLNTERFEADRTAICRQIDPEPSSDETWQWCRLDDMVATLRRSREEGTDRWKSRDQRFDKVLHKTDPEQLDRLALYTPNDSVLIEYRDASGKWKGLAQGSPGQQAAALLAFILRQGEEPIILDQPEDDLDNTIVYELLVKTLREVKAKRQVIVVTHNPNIVVHADAEYVLSLGAWNGQTHVVCHGGLQDQEVRQEICRVMEGGEEAFRKRYHRIVPREEEGDA